MSAGGLLPPVEDASWVEGLGWFAGGDLPLAWGSTARP